jgi:Lysylphosphatidylglycerol synthase TM region
MTEDEKAEPRTPRRFRRAVSWLLPYAVSALVIAFILRRYSLSDIEAEMKKGHALPLVPIAAVTYVGSLLFVAAADRLVLKSKIGVERVPSLLSMAKGKAASVLLHIVHYALGQGAYATWLARSAGLSVVGAGGLILYIIASELGSVCLFATLVILIARPDLPRVVFPVVGATAAGIAGSFLLVPSTRLERVALLATWSEVGRSRGLQQLAIRLAQHACTTTGTWFAARAFGLDVPLAVMLSYMPVILVVGSLPINVAGFGAVQGAWLLLSPWAPAERILAFSVVWQAISAAAVIARGLPFLRGVLADIRKGRAHSLRSLTSRSSFTKAL